MAAAKWIICVACILGTLSVVAAIKCYECNSNSNYACADAGQIGQLYTDCSSLPGRDRCMKTRGPGSLVTRACAGNIMADGCSTNTLTGMETCLCSTNYCNGSSKGSAASLFIMVSSVIFYLIY